MKKILKQRGFYAVLAAAALVTAAFVMTCINPVDVSSLKGYTKDFQIPEGKGVIKLSFGNSARTILPEVPELEDLFYTVIIRDMDNSGAIVDLDTQAIEDEDKDTLEGATIVLEPGTYSVQVLAAASAGGVPLLEGITEEDIELEAGDDETVDISLKGIVDGEDEGSLTYEFILPANTPDSSSLKILAYPGRATVLTPASLSNTELPLDSGYYYVEITYSKADYQTNVITWILHVYPGLESVMEPCNLPELNKNMFTVTYNANNAGVSGYSYTDYPVANGATINKPTGTNAPTLAGYVVQGWYKESGTTSEWTFGTGGDRVWLDRSLYAKWTQNDAALSISIDLTLEEIGEPTVTGSGIFYLSEINTGLSVTISAEDGYDGYVWSYNGDNNFASGATFTLTNNDAGVIAGYLVKGTHTFTVRATKDDLPYSASFVLDVQY
jgi:uncharacterized repeat protein (TIGR02543 family)